MIGAAVFQLRAECAGTIAETQGRLLHAAFFQILKSYSAELAACVHANVRFKAFTVSELLPSGAVRRKNNTLFVRKGDCFFWRVTVLRDDLLQAVASVTEGYRMQIGSVAVTVEQIFLSGEEHKNAGILDEKELIAACKSLEQIQCITFQFVSPVSFRSFQDDYPFPLPQLIFGSLADKWNLAGMPGSFDRSQICEMASRLLPLAWRGKTKQVYLKKDRGITGFVGEFSFETDMLSVEDQQTLLLLAQFAFFSGVGRLTGQGLGQTLIHFQ